MNDSKLWKAFSLAIRLRDVGNDGKGKCFTCPRTIHYTEGDCGHGIPRQHKSTKYHEQNNHLQCKKCNGFEGGEQVEYAKEVDRRYGVGTWDKLRIMSRQVCKRGKFEIDRMTDWYKDEIVRLKKEKGL